MKIKELKIPSNPDRLPQVDELAQKAAREMGFTKEQSDDISIAVTEIVNNAIIHGNKTDTSKNVIITFKIEKDQLTIVITDEGNGFNPDEVDDPTAPGNILKSKGRGIYIVRHLMDKVSFSSGPDGMIITMIKYK